MISLCFFLFLFDVVYQLSGNSNDLCFNRATNHFIVCSYFVLMHSIKKQELQSVLTNEKMYEVLKRIFSVIFLSGFYSKWWLLGRKIINQPRTLRLIINEQRGFSKINISTAIIKRLDIFKIDLPAMKWCRPDLK